MQIESVKIDALSFDPANARKHSKKNLDAIKGSLAKFGQQKPIIVDKNGVVVAGNGTMEAAKSLGWNEINVVRTELTGPDAIAFALADNRTAELAEWDLDPLNKTLQSLKDIDFDLGAIGFDDDFMEAHTPEVIKEGLTDEDAVPEQVETRCKPGDLWTLGNHRLLCGDSTNVQHVERLMGGEKADMVFTDPPYNQETNGGFKGNIGSALRKQSKEIEHLCEFKPEMFLSILPVVFEKNKLNAYCFCNKDLVVDYLKWSRDFGYSYNILIWKKPSAIPIGGSYRPDVEYLLVFRKSGIFNGAIPDVNYSKVLEHKREIDKIHPTMKPVEMIENQLKIASNPESVVMDFFLGSGSTLIACEKTNRKCYGCEIDPHYVSVSIERWMKFTGKEAYRLDADGSKKPYSQCE